MKKRIILCMLGLTLSISILAGCSSKADSTAETETVKATETAHEHNYTETITLAATCETDGEATYTCECGDTYTEVIKATGHSFTNYVSNNDATYTEDGTETAKCDNCDATDTRTAEGSKLAYTFTDMDATKYAKSTVNVRSMPNQDGEKLGGLSTNNEVKVTGQCNETGWYRIEYNGNTAYVSDSYLVDNKIETKKASSSDSSSSSSSNNSSSSSSTTSSASQSSSSQSSDSSNTSKTLTYAEAHAYFASKYSPLDTIIDNGNGSYSYYEIISHGPSRDGAVDMEAQLYDMIKQQYTGGWRVDGNYEHIEKIGSDWDLVYNTVVVTVK